MAASLETRIAALEQAMGAKEAGFVIVFDGDPEPPPGMKVIRVEFVDSKPHVHQPEQENAIST